jgi:hypothetical protein
MQTIIPLAALLALGVAGCSGSASSLTGPDEDIKATMDPAARGPRTPCELPDGHPHGHRVALSPISGSGALSVWYSSSRVESATGCARVSPSA